MTIVNQLKQDQLQARKDRDGDLSSFLTTVYSEVVTVGKDDGNRETTDQEAIKVLKQYIKRADEMKDILEGDGSMMNVDGIDTANFEIEVINRYLPEQLSEDRIDHIIADIIGEHNLTSMKGLGVIMKALKNEFEGRFDGAVASKSAKRQLTIQAEIAAGK